MKKVIIRYSLHQFKDELLSQCPSGVELVFSESEQEFLQELVNADAIYGHIAEDEYDQAMPLSWIQHNATGYDGLMFHSLQKSNVIVTGINGLLANTVAEHGVALLLALSRNIHVLRDQQRERIWSVIPGQEIEGMTVTIIGAGNIGTKLARKLSAMGMLVTGIDIKCQPEKEGFIEVYEFEKLPDLLSESDVVFICCPRTERTVNLLGKREFDLMPKGSYVINVSRGGIINEQDLVVALNSDHLGGAALDVTSTEPLPVDSPLWSIHNLMLTPHSAGYSPYTMPRKKERFLTNLHRWNEGRHLVDILPIG